MIPYWGKELNLTKDCRRISVEKKVGGRTYMDASHPAQGAAD
jgi:hypothetical protein